MNFGLSSSSMSDNNRNMNSSRHVSSMAPPDDNEDDVLNDETFGDCDLDAIKIKSDFGENGEFLGETLPDFFDNGLGDSGGDGFSLTDLNDQSQQPSIDALLGEDMITMPSSSLGLREESTINSLFSTAISQANEVNNGNPFSQTLMSIQRSSPISLPNPVAPNPVQRSAFPQQTQINYQLLAQFDQMLISRQVPSRERLLYMHAMLEKLQREASHVQRQNTTQIPDFNQNGHDQYREANLNRMSMTNSSQTREPTRPMTVVDMMQRAQLSAAHSPQNQIQSNRTQSPPTQQNQGMSSQMMDAIQRSDQIPTVDNRQATSPLSPMENIVSPPSHHQGQSRHNRQPKHYPRPPCLNTWQGRGPGHDEFAGMMNDREKQWVVKIQLHQVTQTKEEDFYFQKWCQRKVQAQQNSGTQLNRYDHRGQYITYPVLQLLKSIQQEKELADRLSQSSAQATFSNVNPIPNLPYATPLQTQLGKQSTATPRHPRCILDLDGAFTIGTRANAITHGKYDLGILLHVENIYRDLMRLEKDEENSNTTVSIDSIIDRYLNDQQYLFGDIFGSSRKGQWILHRIFSYLSRQSAPIDKFEPILVRIYGSLLFMIERWPKTFYIEPIVLSAISSIQQNVNVKSIRFEQIVIDFQNYYQEKVRPKLVEFHQKAASNAFLDPILFNNTDSATILIEFLLTLERRCYLSPLSSNSSQMPVQILQQLQNQIQYQLSEPVRNLVNDICQSLILCSTPKKIRKTLPQIQNPVFGLLSKFLQSQLTKANYQMVEPKLISCCIKDN